MSVDLKVITAPHDRGNAQPSGTVSDTAKQMAPANKLAIAMGKTTVQVGYLMAPNAAEKYTLSAAAGVDQNKFYDALLKSLPIMGLTPADLSPLDAAQPKAGVMIDASKIAKAITQIEQKSPEIKKIFDTATQTPPATAPSAPKRADIGSLKGKAWTAEELKDLREALKHPHDEQTVIKAQNDLEAHGFSTGTANHATTDGHTPKNELDGKEGRVTRKKIKIVLGVDDEKPAAKQKQPNQKPLSLAPTR